MMKRYPRHYRTFLLLVLIFAAPGLFAYFFYNHPDWLGSTRTNKGHLITPPIKRPLLTDNKDQWRLVFWQPDGCDPTCLSQLDQLARVRLALGRRALQVKTMLLLGKHAHSLSDTQRALLKDQDILMTRLDENLSDDNWPSQARIYIQNPDDFLILAYPKDVKPKDVYRDLKHLLKQE